MYKTSNKYRNDFSKSTFTSLIIQKLQRSQRIIKFLIFTNTGQTLVIKKKDLEDVSWFILVLRTFKGKLSILKLS